LWCVGCGGVLFIVVFVDWSAFKLDLHSFPTRRSSDLPLGAHPRSVRPGLVESHGAGLWITARRTSRTSRKWPTRPLRRRLPTTRDRKSTRLNSSHVKISYAVFCLKKKKKQINQIAKRS